VTGESELAALEGLVAESTGIRLAALAQHISPEHAIVELGAYKGKSTCYLAAGAMRGRGAHVYTVDAWDMPQNIYGKHGFTDPAVRAKFDEQVDSLGMNDKITAIQGLSARVARTWMRPVGMLFIDASHEYDDVRADYYAWARHLVPGATVVFDDYSRRNRGVVRFVDELRRDDALSGWDFETPPLAAAWRRR
jgi:MMP 1-O-methyltransferase